MFDLARINYLETKAWKLTASQDELRELQQFHAMLEMKSKDYRITRNWLEREYE